MENDSTRDRIRALVRDVLEKAGPLPEGAPESTPTRFACCPVKSSRYSAASASLAMISACAYSSSIVRMRTLSSRSSL